MTFEELGINTAIEKALQENKLTEPTDIQQLVIPHLFHSTTDLVAIAQTGTGKTAAFCLPILQNVDPNSKQIQALVLVPTRELGQQVARQFYLYSKYLARVFAESVYGGAPIDDQITRLKRATHIVVATPGRLIDLLERNALNLKHLKYMVLDEADEMINMGFKTEIDKILSLTNQNIRKMLFSATLPADVKSIIDDYLKPDYKNIQIKAEEFVNRNIEHKYLIYQDGNKINYLKAFLSERYLQRGICFCRTKTDAKRLAKQLAGFEVVADALHGNLNQEMRDKVMRGFKKNRINLLVATDIAARGIDVKELDYIIHYHLPEKPEYYTHRSGRTARAGKSGISVCMIKTDDLPILKMLEKELNIHFSELNALLSTELINDASKRFYINLGLSQGFTRNNMIDFLVEEAGLHREDIQKMTVEDARAHFEIPANYEQQLLINLKGYKLFHRNVKIT